MKNLIKINKKTKYYLLRKERHSNIILLDLRPIKNTHPIHIL